MFEISELRLIKELARNEADRLRVERKRKTDKMRGIKERNKALYKIMARCDLDIKTQSGRVRSEVLVQYR